MVARAGFKAESVNVVDGDMESFLDPFGRLFSNVSRRRMRGYRFRDVFRQVRFTDVGARGAVPQGVEISDPDKHSVPAGIPFGLRFQKPADALKRLLDIALNLFEPRQ